MSFVVVRCRSCGAPLPIQPDNLLMICAHCGHTYPTEELDGLPIHVVPTVSEAAVRDAVITRMANDRQMKRVRIHITSASGVFVPFFVGRAHVKGGWNGYKMIRSGNSRRRDYRYGNLEQEGDFPVLGRKHAQEFGLRTLGRVLFDVPSVPMSTLDWQSTALSVLSIDRTGEQVDAVVKDDLIDLLGVRIREENRLDAITAFDMDVAVRDRFLLLVPLWTVTYRYRGGSYRVAVNGGSGTVIAATEPTFFLRRIWSLLLGLGGIGGAGTLVFIGVLALPFLSGEEDTLGFAGVLGACVLACMAVAWRTGRAFVASVQVERLGDAERWL